MENVIFHITGTLGIIFFVLAVLNQDNNKLKMNMVIGHIFFATQMFFTMQYSGMVSNLLSAFRNYFAIKFGFSKHKHLIFLIFFSMYLVFNYMTNDIYWLLPTTGTILALINFFYFKKEWLRYGMILTSLTWLIYSYLFNNYYGIAIEIILISFNIYSIIKHERVFEN